MKTMRMSTQPLSVTKKVRTKDQKALILCRNRPCLACGKSKSEAHHIKSKGSGGPDEEWNLIPLCSGCHTIGSKAWHKIGWSKFFELYPHVKRHLESQGWEVFNGKLINSKTMQRP